MYRWAFHKIVWSNWSIDSSVVNSYSVFLSISPKPNLHLRQKYTQKIENLIYSPSRQLGIFPSCSETLTTLKLGTLFKIIDKKYVTIYNDFQFQIKRRNIIEKLALSFPSIVSKFYFVNCKESILSENVENWV